MNSLIFRTLTPLLVTIIIVFSVYVLLRGHNEPGGGFIGGLIAASAMAIFGMSSGVSEVRRAVRFDPLGIAGFGLCVSVLSGLASLFTASPFLTAIWLYLPLGDTVVPFSTPMFFDIGVYFVVFGTITAVALSLESDDGEEV